MQAEKLLSMRKKLFGLGCAVYIEYNLADFELLFESTGHFSAKLPYSE